MLIGGTWWGPGEGEVYELTMHQGFGYNRLFVVYGECLLFHPCVMCVCVCVMGLILMRRQ